MVVHHHDAATPADTRLDMLEESLHSGDVGLGTDDELHLVPMVRNTADNGNGLTPIFVQPDVN